MSADPKPSGFARWYAENRILTWICALTFVNQLGFGAIVPAVPLYARSFGVSLTAIGLTIAGYGLARMVSSLPAGQISDRYGRTYALAIGGIITVVGNVLCALATSYEPFLAARFVAGLGAGFILTASGIMLADISTPERRGRIMATYAGVFGFAVGLGPLPGGLMAEHFGLSAPFWAYAVMGGGAALLAWLRVPETRELRTATGGASGRSAQDRPPFLTQVRMMTVQPGFLVVTLVSFAVFFSRTGGLFNVIPVLGQERLGLSPDQIGLGLASVSVVSILLAYPSGVFADRYGRKVVIVPSTILTGLSFMLFMLAPSFAWFMAACIAWSIAGGIGGAAPSAYAADIAPPGMNAAAMSSFRMFAETGYVLGPIVLGLIADLSGANAALSAATTLLVVSGLLFAMFAPERRRHPAPGSGWGRARRARACRYRPGGKSATSSPSEIGWCTPPS
jgi:multidrug resistance protein